MSSVNSIKKKRFREKLFFLTFKLATGVQVLHIQDFVHDNSVIKVVFTFISYLSSVPLKPSAVSSEGNAIECAPRPAQTCLC